ncbi:MAG: hypothetical protein JWL80_524, partial [Parcubacteria group bacterium]|nr:hypothetical protein [Parcubacteria group bacterium]
MVYIVPFPGVTCFEPEPLPLRLPGLMVHDPPVLFITDIVAVVDGLTVTVAESEALPKLFEQVFVYVVVTAGDWLVDPLTPVDALHQLEEHEVAPDEDQDTVELLPFVIEVGFAVTETTGGALGHEPPAGEIITSGALMVEPKA